MSIPSKLKDAKKEAIFSELANLSKKKALLENKLMDLQYQELNINSTPEKFDFFPSNNTRRQGMPFRPDMEDDQTDAQVGRMERIIGNMIVCMPKTMDQNKPENKTILMNIKYKKMALLKKLNVLIQRINTLERQYLTLERQDFPQLFF